MAEEETKREGVGRVGGTYLLELCSVQRQRFGAAVMNCGLLVLQQHTACSTKQGFATNMTRCVMSVSASCKPQKKHRRGC